MICKFPYIEGLSSFVVGNLPECIADINPEELPTAVSFINSSADDLFSSTVLQMEIDRIMGMEDIPRPDTDFILAPIIHQELKENGCNRMAASKIDIWDYMTVFEFSEYVTWRWPNNPKTRYVGGNRGDNALSRLWFWAEMTYDEENGDDPYHYTKDVRLKQDTMQYVLDTRLPQNERSLKIICKHIISNGLSAGQIIELFKKSRIANASRKFEFMDPRDLDAQLGMLIGSN